MIAEIGGGLSSLKSAVGLLQSLGTIKTEAAVNEVKIQLQTLMLDAQKSLLAAQEAQASDTKRIEELESEIMRLKDWEAERQRYELADAGQGALAYRHKAGMEGGETPHWLCPTCYQNRKKSYLQPEIVAVGRARVLRCQVCRDDLIISGVRMSGRR